MHRVLAIALIAVRSAVRSRMVVCLLALLAIAVVGLPLTIKGDGTAEGHLRIVITYSLGAAFALLILANLWAGALSIAQEVEERQIQLLASKPVRSAEIWLGKWLGLMGVNTLLLLAAGTTTLFLLPRQTIEEDVEHGRDWKAVFRPVEPAREDVEGPARALLAERRRAGEIPESVSDATALRVLMQEVTLRRATVAPGRMRQWTIPLPRPVRPDESIRLRVRFSAASMYLAPVMGRWRVGSAERPDAWSMTVTNRPNVAHFVEIPGDVLAGAHQLKVSYLNEDAGGITVVFDPVDGLQAQLPAGSFAANYARALVLLWLRLGFVAALGVTTGALFSSPVALFMALSLMLMTQLVSRADTLPGHAEPSAAYHLLDVPARVISRAMQPLETPDALDAAATGRLVELRWLGKVAGIQVLVYGGLLVWFGAAVLNRRELALPQR